MTQPSDFDPSQPPPVQPPADAPQGENAPMEVDYGQFAPPPQEGEPARPNTVYMSQSAWQPPPKRPASPLAFLLGLLGTLIFVVAGMMPVVSPNQPAKPVGVDEHGEMFFEKVGLQPSDKSVVLFDKLGTEFEVRFDPKFYFMWAAFILALATLWLTLIRSWIAFWIIGLGMLITAGVLYVMIMRTAKPGMGMPAFAVGAVVILLAAMVGGRSSKTARYQYG